jgi:hypothetical protein
MTLEKASELVNALREAYKPPCTKAEDLFEHFVEALGLETQEELEMFAVMCGYGTISQVELL